MRFYFHIAASYTTFPYGDRHNLFSFEKKEKEIISNIILTSFCFIFSMKFLKSNFLQSQLAEDTLEKTVLKNPLYSCCNSS